MSSLADLPELVGFFSYSREDDADSHGELSALRSRIQGELRGQLGRTAKTFRLWQDKEAIPSGAMWESEIKNSVEQAAFFIPIITPTVIASPYCRFELEAFLAREAALGRSDLIFPILYIRVPALEDSARREGDPVVSIVAKRQYVDWREFRHLDISSTEVKKAIERFCADICDALSKPWLSPGERKQQERAPAQHQAEAEHQRQQQEEKQAQRPAEKGRSEQAAETEQNNAGAQRQRADPALLRAEGEPKPSSAEKEGRTQEKLQLPHPEWAATRGMGSETPPQIQSEESEAQAAPKRLLPFLLIVQGTLGAAALMSLLCIAASETYFIWSRWSNYPYYLLVASDVVAAVIGVGLLLPRYKSTRLGTRAPLVTSIFGLVGSILAASSSYKMMSAGYYSVLQVPALLGILTYGLIAVWTMREVKSKQT